MTASTWTWLGTSSDPQNAANWSLTSGASNLKNRPQAGDTAIIPGGGGIIPPALLDAKLNSTTLDLTAQAGFVFTNDTTSASASGIDALSTIDATGTATTMTVSGPFTNSGTIEVTGTGSSLAITVAANASIAGAFTNNGQIIVNKGDSLAISTAGSSTYSDGGTIVVAGGSALLSATVSGAVNATIGLGGSLEFNQQSKSGHINIGFGGAGTLKLDQAGNFNGSTGFISGFTLGDTLDLGVVNIAKVTFDGNGDLIATNTTGGTVFSTQTDFGPLGGFGNVAAFALTPTGGLAGKVNVSEGNGGDTILTIAPPGPPTTWLWLNGATAAGSTKADWSVFSGPGNVWGFPQAGDTAIDAGGTILLGNNPNLQSNTLLVGGTASVAALLTSGDTGESLATPTLDSASIIESAVPGNTTAETSLLSTAGIFVNEGTILANGPAGSQFTIAIGGTMINTTILPGYFYNTNLIQANAGNTLTISIGGTSEVFNSGSIVADGGTVKILAGTSAISGGFAAVAGFAVIEGGGTLETQASYPLVNGNLPGGTSPRYEFGDTTAGNTLKIDNLGSFGGSVIGFQAGDTVDLGTLLAIGTIAYDTTTSLLKLEAAGGAILDELFLTANGMTTGAFALNNGTADGITVGSIVANGTTDTVLTTTRINPTASNVSGTWQSTASWNNNTIPGPADTPLVGLPPTAGGVINDFTLTTGSAPVAVNGISLYSPHATLRITSNTTTTPGIMNDYAGTLEVTGGNTLTTSYVRLFSPQSSVTIDSGGTVDVTGRASNNLAATNGIVAFPPGNTGAMQVAAGTVVVAGALLGGPPTAAGGGGNISIGLDGAGSPASMIVNGDGKAGDGVVTDTYAVLGSGPTSFGSLTLNGAGASWTDTIDAADPLSSRGFMLVGFNNLSQNTPAGQIAPDDAAAAQLLIENGATLTDQQAGYIADTTYSAGTVTVTTGGLWNLASNGVGFLNVGYLGDGALSILNGGSVTIGAVGTFFGNGTSFTGGGLSIGRAVGATGTVTVSGAGSQLSTLNGMGVGQSGRGELDVLNGGSVIVRAGGITIGQNGGPGSSGTVNVGGSGASASVSFSAASGPSPAAGGITVGNFGQGALTVGDNGTITLNGTGGILAGQNSGVTGVVTVGGSANSAVINIGTSGMTIGQSGTGFMTVGNLGTIAMTGTGGIGIGQSANGQGTLTIDGGLLTQSASGNGIGLGNATGANGSLIIQNNGTVSLAGNWLSAGGGSGGNGTISIQGTGALLTLTGTAGLTLGNSGFGVMNLATGGNVVLSGSGGVMLGQNAGSTGQLTVSGASFTEGASTTGMTIGGAGGGTLTINNNGTVTDSKGLTIGASGGHGSVSVASGMLTAASMTVGNSGSGTLVISGGTVTDSGVLGIGVAAFSSGTVSVTGAGSSLTASGGIEVGEAGSGTFTVQGATVTTSNFSLGGSATAPLGNAANRASLTAAADLAVTGVLAVWQGSTLLVDATSGVDAGTSGIYIAGKINLENGHSLVGDGLIAAGVVNNGLIEALGSTAPGSFSAGTLEIQGGITGTGALQIGANSILRLDAAPPSGEAIQFGPSSELILNTPGSGLANPITGLNDGDKIELNLGAGVFINSASVTGAGTVTVFTSTGNYQLTNVGFAAGSGTSFLVGNDPSTGYAYIQQITANRCFVVGTLIETVNGTVGGELAAGGAMGSEGPGSERPGSEVPVEDLRVGDHVLTADGRAEAVVWIGSRTVNCARHPRPESVWPVRVSAGVFGPGLPARDLWLSPDHAVYVRGALVPVKLLINGTSIVQVAQDRVTYFHVELAAHEVILAEGMAVESYLNAGNWEDFGDGTTIRLHPEFGSLTPDTARIWETRGAAPLVVSGRALEKARSSVRDWEKMGRALRVNAGSVRSSV